MKNYLKNKSWITTTLGVIAILWGLRSAFVLYVHTQTVWFNLIYVLPGAMAMIFAGWIGIHARDHRCKDKDNNHS